MKTKVNPWFCCTFKLLHKVQNTLKHEDITKVEEIKGKFNKIWLSSEALQAHLNILTSF